MNCMSIARKPSPWHVSQRPPSTLKLKWPAVRFRVRASICSANSMRIGSNALRYVAGFDRGERPIGLWSMRITSSSWPSPSTSSYGSGCGRSAGSSLFLHAAGEGRVKRFVDERAFSGAAHARHQAQNAERKLDRHVLQIVAACAAKLDPTLCGRAALRRCRSCVGRRASRRCGCPSAVSNSCGVP